MFILHKIRRGMTIEIYVVWRRQAITWTSVDKSSASSSGIHEVDISKVSHYD